MFKAVRRIIGCIRTSLLFCCCCWILLDCCGFLFKRWESTLIRRIYRAFRHFCRFILGSWIMSSVWPLFSCWFLFRTHLSFHWRRSRSFRLTFALLSLPISWSECSWWIQNRSLRISSCWCGCLIRTIYAGVWASFARYYCWACYLPFWIILACCGQKPKAW